MWPVLTGGDKWRSGGFVPQSVKEKLRRAVSESGAGAPTTFGADVAAFLVYDCCLALRAKLELL